MAGCREFSATSPEALTNLTIFRDIWIVYVIVPVLAATDDALSKREHSLPITLAEARVHIVAGARHLDQLRCGAGCLEGVMQTPSLRCGHRAIILAVKGQEPRRINVRVIHRARLVCPFNAETGTTIEQHGFGRPLAIVAERIVGTPIRGGVIVHLIHIRWTIEIDDRLHLVGDLWVHGVRPDKKGVIRAGAQHGDEVASR